MVTRLVKTIRGCACKKYFRAQFIAPTPGPMPGPSPATCNAGDWVVKILRTGCLACKAGISIYKAGNKYKLDRDWEVRVTDTDYGTVEPFYIVSILSFYTLYS